MAATTSGVSMTFKTDGGTFTKTLSGMIATQIKDEASTRDFATKYANIVAGTLTGAKLIVTTPVTIESNG